jgi:hypothetical protein
MGLPHGKQKTFSASWRWIFNIYSPQPLDAFGAYRFRFSELVPLNRTLDPRPLIPRGCGRRELISDGLVA